MRVGGLDVRGLRATASSRPRSIFVSTWTGAQAAELAGAQPDGSLFIPVNNFLFQRDGKIIMIDAGAGNTMQPTLGKLPENLRAAASTRRPSPIS